MYLFLGMNGIPGPQNTSERFEIGIKGRYRPLMAEILEPLHHLYAEK